jgi:hypothetical protein
MHQQHYISIRFINNKATATATAAAAITTTYGAPALLINTSTFDNYIYVFFF